MTAETRARAADIVERLRSLDHCDCAGTNEEAAAEIERLREERREAAMQALADQAQFEMHLAKIERLRAALRDLTEAVLDQNPHDAGLVPMRVRLAAMSTRAALERAP